MFISLGILLFTKKYLTYALIGAIGAFIIIAVNLLIVILTISRIKFYFRYDSYMNVLGHHEIEIVEDLAAYSRKSIEVVIRDLTRSVHLKFIPQGHFGTNNMIFIVSDDMYIKYRQKQTVYDRYYRKKIEERARMKERTSRMQRIMDSGHDHVEKIHECNNIIKDKNISEKLDRMEKVVSMIFREVDINPKQAGKLGMFLNYYLPTSEKLLEAYIDLDEKQVKASSLEKTQKDIEESLDMINSAFEAILDKFYQEHELDIASDISAMEIMMKQEGLAKEDT